MDIKTLWREPAAVIGVLEAALAFALTLTTIDPNKQGLLMAFAVAVGGIYGAWATQTTLLGALVGVIKTGAVLVATYHYSFSETSQATLIAVITAGLSLAYRTQTSPVGAVVADQVATPTAPAEQAYSQTAAGEPLTAQLPGGGSATTKPARDSRGRYIDTTPGE